MANFLDLTTGLPALWAKIKSKFYTKAEVDALIPEDEVMVVNIDSNGETYSADKTYAEMASFIRNGGKTIIAQFQQKMYPLVYLNDNNGMSDTYGEIDFSMMISSSHYETSPTEVYEDAIITTGFSVDNNDNVTYFKYVANAAADTNPLMDGTATVGTSSKYSRADHVHPTDTSRAAVADVLTKTNATSYTPTADYNPATKKYVDDTVAAIPSDIMLVTITYDSTNKTYSADKTYDEIIAHIDNGGTVIAIDRFMNRYYLSSGFKSSDRNDIRFSKTIAYEDYSTSPTDHYGKSVVTYNIAITKENVVTMIDTIVSNSCATTAEIEEMCDALGFISVTIDTSDYEERSGNV